MFFPLVRLSHSRPPWLTGLQPKAAAPRLHEQSAHAVLLRRNLVNCRLGDVFEDKELKEVTLFFIQTYIMS